MALSYPTYFPKDFLGPVVSAEAEAEHQFRIAVAKASGGYATTNQIERSAREYVSTLVFAFAQQACVAVRASKLSLHRIGYFVEEFEHHVSVHAYYHLDLNRRWSRWEPFRDDVIPGIHESAGWLEHLQDRARCSQGRDDSPDIDNKQRDRAKRRKAIVMPLLKRESLTRSKWAAKAGVAPDVVYDYLDGRTSPRPDNRSALAEVLGLDELPE